MIKKKKYTFKKFINDIHLWLGVGSGIILFLVCFSGTLLVFENEIKDVFKEKLTINPVESEVQSITQLSQKLSVNGEVKRLTIPVEKDAPYEFNIKTSPEDRRGTTFLVNPYTSETLLPKKTSLDEFFSTMFKMHRWLLLDVPVGRPILGIATIIFLVLSVTGIILWFPKKYKWKNFKPGFKIKFSANWKRINHDLHNTLGFYACIFIIIMALTGLNWSFDWYREGASDVIGAKIFNRGGGPKFKSSIPKNEKSVEELIEISSQELNYSGKLRITFATTSNDIIEIRKYNSNNFSPVTSDRLILDRDGKVLHKEIFDEKPLNVQLASVIKPLHTGEIYGSFSKIIYFITCLIATSLPVTGTIIWLNKLKKKKKKS